ncbi:MAG: SPOR domain-containing protein [Chromatiaceae bacterium]|nr:SPOR domain-containing protein [Chromatiaceae bacterium]
MPRDYKHRAHKKPQKKPLPGWLWLLTGLLLGGMIVGLVWLKGQSLDAGGDWVGAKPDRPPQGKAAAAKVVETPPPPKPRFDFYSELPKMEVVVPDEEIDRPARAPERSPAVAEVYLLQVGSFRRAQDADRLKAQLALLGFEAEVVRAQLNPQDARYRVRSGPYAGTQALNSARRRLADNGFKGIVIRVGGG